MSTAKGTRFETTLLPLLNLYWPDTVRLGKQGVNDKGDFHMPRNKLYIVEAKNCKTMEIPKWLREADREAKNAGVPFGVVVHKRKGIAHPEQQYLTMAFGDFLELVHNPGPGIQ